MAAFFVDSHLSELLDQVFGRMFVLDFARKVRNSAPEIVCQVVLFLRRSDINLELELLFHEFEAFFALQEANSE